MQGDILRPLENIKPETILHALEEKEIYISTKTACATNDSSDAVYAITKDEEKAKHSLRISLSYLTTKKELEIFITELVRIRSELSSLYAKKE